MRNLKLTIEYDGTLFHGWQVQPKGQRTVQGEIEKALKKICKQKIRLIGSGRTDSGVHALGQVANFKTKSKLSTREFLRALNANLPDDIAIVKVEEVPANFHSQYSVKSKTYRYSILNRVAPCAQQKNFLLYYPYHLNWAGMRKESKALIGKKDFKSFQSTDPARKDRNTVRTIKRLDIKKKADVITIDVEANGFLYKMVRNIVGTLLDVGRGKLPKGSLPQILKSKDRSQAGDTAKARGLCLMEVKY